MSEGAREAQIAARGGLQEEIYDCYGNPATNQRGSNNMKLCKDCRFFAPGAEICNHQFNTRINLVTGETEYINRPILLRMGNYVEPGKCGEKGAWWEPANPHR